MDLLGATMAWIINTVPPGSLYLFPPDSGWWVGVARVSEREYLGPEPSEVDARLLRYWAT